MCFLQKNTKVIGILIMKNRRRKDGNGKSWYESEENKAKLSATKYFFISLLVCLPSSTAYCLLPTDVHAPSPSPLLIEALLAGQWALGIDQ